MAGALPFIALAAYGTDYAGGEFLPVERRPRARSRGTATVLRQGHGLVFTTATGPCAPAAAGRPERCDAG